MQTNGTNEKSEAIPWDRKSIILFGLMFQSSVRDSDFYPKQT